MNIQKKQRTTRTSQPDHNNPINFCRFYFDQLSDDEKEKLAAQMDISRSTLYERVKEPGKLRISEATRFILFVNKYFGTKWDVNMLVLRKVKKAPNPILI